MSRKKQIRGAAKEVTRKTKRKPLSLRFYGDEFVFDTVSGMFYRVTPTASFILRSLDAGTELDQVASDVQKRYGIDRASAVRDIELLRNDLTAIESFGQVHA